MRPGSGLVREHTHDAGLSGSDQSGHVEQPACRTLLHTARSRVLLDMSRLIASRMVFRAQGESPASCARERGLNPAAPMLQHILKKKNLLISIALRSRPRLPPRLPRRGRHPLPKTSYGRPPVTGGCFLHPLILIHLKPNDTTHQRYIFSHDLFVMAPPQTTFFDGNFTSPRQT